MAAIKRAQINKHRKAAARLKPIQSPKPEGRIPKSRKAGRNPKPECRTARELICPSDFELRASFGSRISTFGFMLLERLAETV
jgi:hypothetical protein